MNEGNLHPAVIIPHQMSKIRLCDPILLLYQ